MFKKELSVHDLKDAQQDFTRSQPILKHLSMNYGSQYNLVEGSVNHFALTPRWRKKNLIISITDKSPLLFQLSFFQLSPKFTHSQGEK